MRILVVDDDRAISHMLTILLGDLGHTFATASNGREAWALLSEQPFDMVVSDWRMPEMNGIELCRRIRQRNDSHYVYVILCTGNNQKSDFVEGMEAGADDFVAKPVDIADLRMRIRAAERILNLQEELAAKSTRLERDLGAASALQLLLLPRRLDIHRGARLDWLMMPSSFFAGDMLNYFMVDDRYLVFYQMDVAGHGIPAALRSVMVGRVLTAEPGSPILRPGDGSKRIKLAGPADVVRALNEQFQGEWDEYFTIIYGVFDTQTGEARFCQAGHPAPIHLRPGQEAETIGSGGFPVGLWPGMEYEETYIAMAPGDRLVLYSDGITDCQRPDGLPYSRERFADLLSRHSAAPLSELVQVVRSDVSAWRSARDFSDDLSMLVLECLSAGSTPLRVATRTSLGESLRKAKSAGSGAPDEMRFELTIDSALMHVRLVRAALAGILNDLDIVEEDIIMVEIAVSELVNNIIEHAYHRAKDQKIEVSISITGPDLRILVSDSGEPVPIEQLQHALASPLAEADAAPDFRCRGRGMEIIRQAVDSVVFERGRGRNFATMHKRLTVREE